MINSLRSSCTKVLFVAPFYEPAWFYGGMAKAPAVCAHALATSGLSIDVFTTTANGNCELKVIPSVPLDLNGVRVTYFPRWRWTGNRFISLPLLHACIRATSAYDVIHSVGLWTFPSVVSSWIAARSNIPFLISLHGTLMPWAFQHHGYPKRLFMAIMERRRLALADAVICSSELEKRYFKSLGITDRAFVVPNVVESVDIIPEVSRNRFRSRHNLRDSVVMLFTGRLVRNKGLHLTISAFAKIVERYPQTILIIVGPVEDDSARLAQRQTQELNLGNRVRFLGMLTGDDYWDAIVGSDFLVLNSYSENFGMAPAEALALGVPVLLSDQVGIADHVQQYRAGLVTSLDVDAIAEAMAFMLKQKDALREMGQNGVRLVRDCFSPSIVGRRFADLLEQVRMGH